MGDTIIEKLDIVFKTYEVISIPYSHIETVDISKITTSLLKHSNSKKLYETLEAGFSNIIISRNANIPYNGFYSPNSCTVFERIKNHSDIIYFDIYYRDLDSGEIKNKYISVNWNYASNLRNTYQNTIIDNDGSLVVAIGENINMGVYKLK
ncbi:MAG: hypothetical protein RSF40_01755 [Oscillospiraceae bacterium]